MSYFSAKQKCPSLLPAPGLGGMTSRNLARRLKSLEDQLLPEQPTDASGRGIAFDGKVVLCSVRPTPARKATYLSVAEQLLAESTDAKHREGLQQIVDLLTPLVGNAH